MDDLSQVYNKRTYNFNLKSLFNDAIEKNTNLSLAVIDMDFLKSHNELYTHQRGDLIIKEISSSLKETLKNHKNTSIYRYGGDEFVVLFENYDNEEVLNITRLIITNLKKQLNPYKKDYISQCQTEIGIYQRKIPTAKRKRLTKIKSITNLVKPCHKTMMDLQLALE